MLIDFYLDVYPGVDVRCLGATASPSSVQLPDGWTRLRFTVDVPKQYLDFPVHLDLGTVKAGEPMPIENGGHHGKL
jgi:hypothetical protein